MYAIFIIAVLAFCVICVRKEQKTKNRKQQNVTASTIRANDNIDTGKAVYSVYGNGEILEVFEDKVTITRKFSLTRGIARALAGTTSILFSLIDTVRLNYCWGAWPSGFITFTIYDGKKVGGGLFGATMDVNSFGYYSKDKELVKEITTYIETKIQELLRLQALKELKYTGSVVYNVSGKSTDLEVFEDKLTITPTGLKGAFLKDVQGTKTIFFSGITSIQLSSAYIRFTYAGLYENKGMAFNPAMDENTFVFHAKDEKLIKEIKYYIETQMKKSSAIHSISNADEIRKYKQLLDDGIITRQEFDIKKDELLRK